MIKTFSIDTTSTYRYHPLCLLKGDAIRRTDNAITGIGNNVTIEYTDMDFGNETSAVIEIMDGSPLVHDMGEGANIVTDIPRYFIYKNGVKVDEVTDASEYWQDDFVGFLIGCSFSFEEALLQAGIDVRHISMGRNVPMYKTNIECEKAGVFEGPLVCSMRPMTPEDAKKAAEITEKFPNVHGGPVHMGDPEKIGIKDIDHPDYGDPVEIREGEIPVFWACGVTPQAAVERAKPPIVITHAPGHMFITNVKNAELNDYLEKKKQDTKSL